MKKFLCTCLHDDSCSGHCPAKSKDSGTDSKITGPEAVDVMSAVKVIDGCAGRCDSVPPPLLTCVAAAAKIICNPIWPHHCLCFRG